MEKRVQFNINGNLGYSADQVSSMSLGELLEAVQEAVEEWGEDAKVVVHQVNNRYGANFGSLCRWDLFESDDDEDEDEEW